MSNLSLLAFFALLILVIQLLGCPVAYAFGFGSIMFLIVTGGKLGAVALTAFESTASYSFLAIPLFIMAGELMTTSGIASRLVSFCATILKRFKGGMGMAVILASMLFGMLTGSNIATITCVAGILLPMMTKMGWSKPYVAALLAAAGPLGYMIPPNNNAIMYAVISNCSPNDLFLSTIIPGIIWGVLMMVVNRLIYKKSYNPELSTPDMREMALADGVKEPAKIYLKDVGHALYKAIPALIMPLIIFGGIYGGVFSATEAGAVASLYAILIGVLLYRKITRKGLWKAFNNVGAQMGVILFMTPFCAIFTRILMQNQVPQMIADWFLSLSDNRIILLLIIDVVLLIAGFFLGVTVIIFVLTPLLLPTALALGVSAIQFGCILFVAIGCGNITPPCCPNLFISAKIANVPVVNCFKTIFQYFFFTGIPMLLLVTFIPGLSEWLPSLI